MSMFGRRSDRETRGRRPARARTRGTEEVLQPAVTHRGGGYFKCAPSSPGLARAPAKALGIGDQGQRQLFRIGKLARRLAIKQDELLLQGRMTMTWQGLDEVADHRPQSPHDLQIARPAPAYFT